MVEGINEEEAARFLEQRDRELGVNQVDVESAIEEVQQPPKNLGVVENYSQLNELSGAAESSWKILDLRGLPSGGMFYPEGAELLLRPAKTKEIRQWSTIDENDPIDVREKINFVLNACTKFTLRGAGRPMNFNDFLEIDRYHILFRIYELTFPNQENKLWANIKCDNERCGHVNKIQMGSQNLKGFECPEELLKWYSPEERCFKIISDKLQETIRIYLPSFGVDTKLRQRKTTEINSGVEIDDAFYEFAPYLVGDWRTCDTQYLSNLKFNSQNWQQNKFIIIHKFTKMLKDASLNKAGCKCEKCGSITESHIFLAGSFTVKDIFIISARLDELI
jgi:hypothetical protein